MKYFPLRWAGLWRKRTRTTFTILSVVAAFLLYGLLQGVNVWLSNAIADSRVNRLYTVSRISFIEPLPLSYLQQIESVPGVDKVAYSHWFGGYYQDPKNQVQSYAVDVQRMFDVFKEWQIPKDQLEKMIHTRNGAIVGEATARRFGWKVGDHVPLRTPIWTRPLPSTSCSGILRTRRITRDQALTIMDAPGAKHGADGKPIGSADSLTLVEVATEQGQSWANITMRGVGPKIFELRPEMKIVQGRMFRPAVHEIIVGTKAHSHFEALQVGTRLHFANGEWEIVGVFESGGDRHERSRKRSPPIPRCPST